MQRCCPELAIYRVNFSQQSVCLFTTQFDAGFLRLTSWNGYVVKSVRLQGTLKMNTLSNAGFSNPALSLASPDSRSSDLDMLTLLFDTLAHGVVVVGARGQIIHVNQAARTELNRHRVLGKVGGEIHAVTPADGKTLQDALSKAAAGMRSLVGVSGGDMRLMLAVVPLKRDTAGVRESRIALIFSRAEVSESGMFGFFARRFGLTQTEEQVLAILCRGLRAPEIAVQMKVAVSTVRSHVRSLCAKTDSSGVRELVNRVAVLPPVAPLHLVQVNRA